MTIRLRNRIDSDTELLRVAVGRIDTVAALRRHRGSRPETEDLVRNQESWPRSNWYERKQRLSAPRPKQLDQLEKFSDAQLSPSLARTLKKGGPETQVGVCAQTRG